MPPRSIVIMSDTAADTKSGSNEDTRKVRLRSAEGDSYELPYESALLSILVKNTIEVEDSDEDADGDDDDDDKDSDKNSSGPFGGFGLMRRSLG